MATKQQPEEQQSANEVVIDKRDGQWFRSNAQFPMEDPTPRDGPNKFVRFDPDAHTKVIPTPWIMSQVDAGVLVQTGEPGEADYDEVTAKFEEERQERLARNNDAAKAANLRAEAERLDGQAKRDAANAAGKGVASTNQTPGVQAAKK